MAEIKITVGEISVEAELNDTKIANKILEALPLEGVGNTWGYEIYFAIPVEAKAENPRKSVKIGDLAYWPPGNAFCLFYGRTPISATEEEILPASEVEVIGKMKKDFLKLKKVQSGQLVKIEKA